MSHTFNRAMSLAVKLRAIVVRAAFTLTLVVYAPPIGAQGLEEVFSGFNRPLDRGGRIADYEDRVQKAVGRHVIAGDCMSSCTLWLAYKNTCVEKDAVLWFHAASHGEGVMVRFNSPWRNVSQEDSNYILDSYPLKLRNFLRESGWLATPDFHTLSGEDLAAFGIPLC